MRFQRASLLLFVIMVFAVTCVADSQARIVRLSYLEGNVQLDRGDGNGYIRAFLNMPLIEGASVWTQADGRAEIEFEDGSTVRLAPDSIIQFSELRLRNDGSKVTSIEVKDGTTYFNVKQHDDDAFGVKVGLREITLQKTSEFRLIHDLSQQPLELRVAVMKGELRFANEDGQRITVRKNETLTIDFDDAGRYFLARGIGEEAHDYWNREREEDRVELARKAQQGTIYLADLHHYGSFFEVVGYGRMWRPFSVSFGWDPFSSGSWVWYPGAGYVWVSDYAWGWTPYRYGSWIHIGGRGWCWRPAVVYTTWVPRPVIINPPSGYLRPVLPAGDQRRPVIRVGRGVDNIDFRDDRRRRETDAPGVLVQDRVRGIRQVDARIPADRLVPSGRVRPADGSGDTRIYDRRRDDGDRDRPIDGRVDTRSRTPRVTEGPKVLQRGPKEGEIDAHQDIETPVRTAPPAVEPTPSKPAPSTPVVQDRPSRTPRVESVSPRPVTPVAPVIQDRPSRPSRLDPTPPPVRPPERSSPPPAQPSVAPRVAPAPPSPPPPSRSAPAQTGVKDQ